MGVTLSPYVVESFTVRTDVEKITYLHQKQQGRFDEEHPHPHFRYSFVGVGREPAAEDSNGKVVLEED